MPRITPIIIRADMFGGGERFQEIVQHHQGGNDVDWMKGFPSKTSAILESNELEFEIEK